MASPDIPKRTMKRKCSRGVNTFAGHCNLSFNTLSSLPCTNIFSYLFDIVRNAWPEITFCHDPTNDFKLKRNVFTLIAWTSQSWWLLKMTRRKDRDTELFYCSLLPFLSSSVLDQLPFMMMSHPLIPGSLAPASVSMAMGQMNRLSTLASMANVAQLHANPPARAPTSVIKVSPDAHQPLRLRWLMACGLIWETDIEIVALWDILGTRINCSFLNPSFHVLL